MKVEDNSTDNCSIKHGYKPPLFPLQVIILFSPSTKSSAKGLLQPALGQGEN